MSTTARINLIGRLGGDPEQRYTPDGTSVVDVSVAVDRKWRKNQTDEERKRPIWYRVTLWSFLGEKLIKARDDGRVGKGSLVYFDGSFEPEEYTDRNGEIKHKFVVDAKEFVILVGPKQEAQAEGRPGTSSGRRQQDHAYAYNNPIDDVPF